MINPERVRQVRELRGLTQTELARRTNVEQATIARIENGSLRPSDALLEAIAAQAGFPPQFLRQPNGPDVPLGSLLFRAHASTTLRDKTEAYRFAQVLYEVADVMSARMKPIALRLPQLSESPAVAAGLTRALLGISPDLPIPSLLRVVESAGVLVLAIPFDLDGRDAFSLWAGIEHRRPVIFLSANRPGDRLRFNVAHELGHLVLHSTIKGQVASVEAAADEFAAELLMPEIAMRRDLAPPVTLSGIAKLKPRWRVAIQALVRRAHDLGIITKRQYSYLFQQIGARGWRTEEPAHLAVPVEKPRALRKMAELLYGSPIAYRKMAEDLNLQPQFVKQILDVHAERSEFSGSGAAAPGVAKRKVIPLHRL
jgi:Zn-dependent peptidase ImmA (M78 family)/DNA-binding XRE family transcriptional regulator